MTKSTKEFAKAYKALNAEQKKAVDTIDGPVMVVAGPGTGKTQTLALRIANILLKTDTRPSSILALTYTESGARAMKNRLIALIGPAAYDVTISTFHSFCAEVIRQNPADFTLDPASEPLSELEKFKLIYGLISTSHLSDLRPVNAPYHYVKAILAAISNLKREGISPDRFDKLLASEQADFDSSDLAPSVAKVVAKNLAKNRELSILYRGYQKALTENQTFDFEDMINFVRDAFSNNDEFLRTYQERFQYFLVDEYQDTNSAQNELLQLLTSFWGDQANIFVVGDPDQSIYRFQGASIENMLGFFKQYPSASVITLSANYRSTQIILDAAESVIKHNSSRISDVVPNLDPHLTAISQAAGDPLNMATVNSSTAEGVYLAQAIQKL
ncbi:MAG: UvrD/REP helicase [Microgenomates group bacterium GW2011_GWA2_46_7]|nr:MAG: UvrD/REP helicase [Microgenomates group bacterium GW2011_GWA2_46_7]